MGKEFEKAEIGAGNGFGVVRNETGQVFQIGCFGEENEGPNKKITIKTVDKIGAKGTIRSIACGKSFCMFLGEDKPFSSLSH